MKNRMIISMTLTVLALNTSFAWSGAKKVKANSWWVADKNGCKVYDLSPAGKTIEWSGNCKDGFLDGPGILKRFIDGAVVEIDEGTFVGGKATGRFVVTFSKGNHRYEGDFVNGERTGKGVFIWSNGDRYDGDFVNGERTGRGIFLWTNGNRYEGDVLNGKIHGNGVYIWANGDRYDGDYLDGKRTGKGVFVWQNNNKYDGNFVDGKKNGRGVFSWANGNRYEGDFLDDKRTGKGVYIWANGDRYEGSFVDGVKTGDGVTTKANGNKDKVAPVQANGTAVSLSAKNKAPSATSDCTYKDNGDGTLTDPVSGAIWQSCRLGETWNGQTCTGNAEELNFYNAMIAAKENRMLGKADWYLPTPEMLLGFFKSSCGEEFHSYWTPAPWLSGAVYSVSKSKWPKKWRKEFDAKDGKVYLVRAGSQSDHDVFRKTYDKVVPSYIEKQENTKRQKAEQERQAAIERENESARQKEAKKKKELADALLTKQLASKKPQEMYIAAGKYETTEDYDRAIKLYNAIIDRFPDHDLAIKATDKVVRIKDAQSAKQQASSAANQNDPCSHVYVGKRFDGKAGFGLTWTYEVIGFSKASQKVTIKNVSSSGGGTQEESCSSIPK